MPGGHAAAVGDEHIPARPGCGRISSRPRRRSGRLVDGQQVRAQQRGQRDDQADRRGDPARLTQPGRPQVNTQPYQRRRRGSPPGPHPAARAMRHHNQPLPAPILTPQAALGQTLSGPLRMSLPGQVISIRPQRHAMYASTSGPVRARHGPGPGDSTRPTSQCFDHGECLPAPDRVPASARTTRRPAAMRTYCGCPDSSSGHRSRRALRTDCLPGPGRAEYPYLCTQHRADTCCHKRTDRRLLAHRSPEHRPHSVTGVKWQGKRVNRCKRSRRRM